MTSSEGTIITGAAGEERTGGQEPVPSLAEFVDANPDRGSHGRWSEEEWRQWNEGRWGLGASHTQGNLGAVESQGDSSDPWSRANQATWTPATWRPTSWGQWDKPGYKGDFSDPPSWGGWPHYRLWKRAMTRWDMNTDVLMWRRSEKVLKTFDWDLQSKLDHLTDEALQSSDYLKHIFSILDVLAGEKEESEKRRSIRAALYEGPRCSDETLSQYTLRREAQFSSASRYIQIPDDLKAFMMEEQASLSKQNLQNLRSLTGGASSFSQVMKGLQGP